MNEDQELKATMKALLAVQLKSLPKEDKPEVLLKNAGFEPNQIASLLNKEYGAVIKTLQRADTSKKNVKKKKVKKKGGQEKS